MNAKQEITLLYIEERTSLLGASPSRLAVIQRWLERLKTWLGETPCKQEATKSQPETTPCNGEGTKSKLEETPCLPEASSRKREATKS